MAIPIRIKRSSVPGKRPTINDLQLGELALNTYDGYLFAERDTGGVGIGTTVVLLTPWIENFGAQSIYYNNSVGIGTTNATSSLYVVGDEYVTGVVTATSFSGNATSSDYASIAGIATYATNAGVSTNVIGGIGSITQLQVTGISTFTNGPVLVGTATSTGTASQPLQVTGGVYVSGSVGIGTTNPVNTLQVLGGLTAGDGSSATTLQSGFSILRPNDSTPRTFAIVENNTDLRIGGGAWNNVNIRTAPSNDVRVAITSSGNIGIGTTNPIQPFQIGYAGTFQSFVLDTNGNIGLGTITPTSTISDGVAHRTLHFYSPNSRQVSLRLDNGNSGGNAWLLQSSGGLAGNGQGKFSIYDVNASLYRLTIDSSGNTGIGTTNPTSTLQVQGDARITGAFRDSTNSPGTSGQVLQSTVSGTQWTTAAAGGGGSGKFDTSIDNVLYVQPTGTLDIVGVGTTTSQITTLPASPPEYIIHSLHVTNISNGDAEITAGFVMNARKVPATISVSIGQSGGPGIHTFTVDSASSITVGMAVTGTGNIGETTGIGMTAGLQFNTYVTSVDGNNITLSKPMSGIATGTLFFSPVSLVSSRLPVPVGSAVELLKQPMVLNALDSIVLQSTGAGSGIGSTSTNAITQAANSNFLTVTAGAAITNFLSSGMLIQPTGSNTGIQTNTFVGVGYTPGELSIPMTRPATVALASTSLSFTEVVVPQDGALQVTVVYQSSTDTSYQNGTGTVVGIVTLASLAVPGVTSTTPSVYYGTGLTYPSIIQSIRVSNISDGIIYPGGDYPVSVGIGNSDTIFSWLAYNMVIPRNSSIELCEAPKRIGIGQSIFASSNTPYAIEIQIAGKQKTT